MLRATLTIDAPGAYEVLVSVQGVPETSNARVNGVIQESVWVYVREGGMGDGGGVSAGEFDPSRLREGTSKLPGPERPLAEYRDAASGPTEGPARSHGGSHGYGSLNAHLYFNEFGSPVDVHGTLVELYEYDASFNLVNVQYDLTDANGVVMFYCTEFYVDIHAHLWGTEAKRLTSWETPAACDDTPPTFSINKGSSGRVFLNLEHTVIPGVESAFADSRSEVNFTVISGGSYYSSFNDRIYISSGSVFGTGGLRTQTHEFGHAFHEKALGGMTGWVEEECVPHSYIWRTSDGCAWVEGLAEYFGMAMGYGPWVDASYVDQHCLSWTSSPPYSCTQYGTEDNHLWVEGPVMAFLYDVTDSDNSESYDNITISRAHLADIIESCTVYHPVWSVWVRPDRIHWLIHCIQRQIDGYNGGGFPPSDEPSYYQVSSGHSVSGTEVRRLWRWHFFNSTEMYPPPPSNPLDVTIVGPDWVPEHAWEACSWSASTSGGSGSPTFQWKWDGQFVDPPTGPGPDWWGDTGTDGYKWIEVTVTDASGSAYDAMQVHVDDGTEWGNCF